MSQLTKKAAGAYQTPKVVNVKGVTFGSAKGHQSMRDMHSNTISADKSVKNDITSGTTIGNDVRVKNDFPAGGSVDNKKVKGLFIRSGSGWKNKP